MHHMLCLELGGKGKENLIIELWDGVGTYGIRMGRWSCINMIWKRVCFGMMIMERRSER